MLPLPVCISLSEMCVFAVLGFVHLFCVEDRRPSTGRHFLDRFLARLAEELLHRLWATFSWSNAVPNATGTEKFTVGF